MSKTGLLNCLGAVVVVTGLLMHSVHAARSEGTGPPQRSNALGSAAASAGAVPAGAASLRSVLDKYCVTCHNERLKTAGLMLDSMDVERIGGWAEVWEKVARKLRTQEMPPPGRPRPDQSTYKSAAAWLETALDQAAEANPNPGRVPVHRLSRNEYANAVRDLLGLDIDAQSLLFADEPDHQSFDNIASVLTVSPILLDAYLSAASKISRLAVGDSTINPSVETYSIPTALIQDDRVSEQLPFGSRGGTNI